MNPFHGRPFQGEIILWAVLWYWKYGISYLELQEILAERDVKVDHTTIYRWVQRYAHSVEKRLRCFGSEIFFKINIIDLGLYLQQCRILFFKKGLTDIKILQDIIYKFRRISYIYEDCDQ